MNVNKFGHKKCFSNKSTHVGRLQNENSSVYTAHKTGKTTLEYNYTYASSLNIRSSQDTKKDINQDEQPISTNGESQSEANPNIFQSPR